MGLRPVKDSGGKDFFRLRLGGATTCGKIKTGALTLAWKEGPKAIREAPNDIFSGLQLWSKSRNSLVKARHGHPIYIGQCAGKQVLLTEPDFADWQDRDAKPEPLVDRVGLPCPIGSGAALVTLGINPSGFSPENGPLFMAYDVMSHPEAREMAKTWPKLLADKDCLASYLAAAEQARGLIEKAFRYNVPDLYLKNGPAMALIESKTMEEGGKGVEEILRRIGA